jgi:hypothetical protein
MRQNLRAYCYSTVRQIFCLLKTEPGVVMKKTHFAIASLVLCIASSFATAGQIDVEITGPGTPPIIRASEVTNISFNGAVPASFDGALDADDSTFNRPFSCTSLSGTGTAVAYDLVNITNTSGSPGNIVIGARLPGGATCNANTPDTFFALYSTFNPATPLAGCLAVNDDFGGTFCSQLTFALAAGESRTVVTTAFDNASTADGLFPYGITFAGTTGTVGTGAPAAITLTKRAIPGTTADANLQTVCAAASDTISLNAFGGSVRYCYRVVAAATGGASTQHRITDPQFGTAPFANFPFTLAAGATSPWIGSAPFNASTSVRTTATWQACATAACDAASSTTSTAAGGVVVGAVQANTFSNWSIAALVLLLAGLAVFGVRRYS